MIYNTSIAIQPIEKMGISLGVSSHIVSAYMRLVPGPAPVLDPLTGSR